MKQTINLSKFRGAFYSMGRSEQFSYEGLEVLFDYLEDYDEDMELDVVALCCDFEEAGHYYIAKKYLDSAAYDEYKNLESEDQYNEIRAFLEQNTVIIGETSNNFVFAQF
jgi:hypothetical protein